jgi:hypothetical protein
MKQNAYLVAPPAAVMVDLTRDLMDSLCMAHNLFRSFLPPAAVLSMKLQMISSEDRRIRVDLVKFLTSRQF